MAPVVQPAKILMAMLESGDGRENRESLTLSKSCQCLLPVSPHPALLVGPLPVLDPQGR